MAFISNEILNNKVINYWTEKSKNRGDDEFYPFTENLDIVIYEYFKPDMQKHITWDSKSSTLADAFNQIRNRLEAFPYGISETLLKDNSWELDELANETNYEYHLYSANYRDTEIIFNYNFNSCSWCLDIKNFPLDIGCPTKEEDEDYYIKRSE